MPTQLLSRQQIRERWGGLLTGFEPAPPGHPIAAGMLAGADTDHSEQAILLGRLGPSTKRAVPAVLAGTPPEEAGATGDSNRAAMRIAPVGIAVALHPADLSPRT